MFTIGMIEADAKEIRIEGKFQLLIYVIEYLWWIAEIVKLSFSLNWMLLNWKNDENLNRTR